MANSGEVQKAESMKRMSFEEGTVVVLMVTWQLRLNCTERLLVTHALVLFVFDWSKKGLGVDLGESRLGSGDVAPLLDNRLLDLSGVLSGPGANLLGNVNALLSGLQAGNELGHVLARTLRLQVTGLFGNLLNNSLLLVEALLGSGLEDTSRGAAELPGDLLTLSLGTVLLHVLPAGGTHLLGPLGTLLLGGVTLGHILALLLLDGLTVNNVILDIVLVVSGLTLRLIDSLTLLGTLTFTYERSVAEPDGLLEGNLLVLDETALFEVFVALLFLLGLEVSGVGGVTTLRVTMVALDLLVVLGLFNHHDLVDTTLAGSSNGSNIKSNVILVSLSGGSCRETLMFLVMGVIVMLIMVGVVLGSTAPGIEGEGVQERFAISSLRKS